MFFVLAAGEESLLIDVNDSDENRQEDKTNELISFDSDYFTPVNNSSSNNNLQNQTMNVSNRKQKNK